MLFMSVISGRNPHYLIGEQVLGFKYLVFDPFKNKKWHGENLYSWKAGRVIKLTDFILQKN